MTQSQPPLPPPPGPPGPPVTPQPQPGPGWGAGASWAPPKPIGPAPGVVYASHGARLGAFLIDGLIVGLLFGLAFAVVGFLVALTVASTAATRSPGAFFAFFAFFPLLILGSYVVQGGYFAVSWYRGGATPGMRVVGIRVVRSVDGGPLTKQQAILRTVGYWVSSAVLYLGFIWILIDDRHQGWHDKIADTLVVEAR